MGNVYKSPLFEYTVIKKGTFYALSVKRISDGHSFGRALQFTRGRMFELLHELGLPDDFIKICMFD